MPHNLRSWRSEYLHVRVLLRELGTRKFLISVGDGQLTHFHPANDCDADMARVLAEAHAAAFARLGGVSKDQEAAAVIEWVAEEPS